jgi:DNA polymerase eta
MLRSPPSNSSHPRILVDNSAKNFQPALNTSESAARWLRVLCADLASRVGEDEDHRLPRTLTIHHRHGGSTKSRQVPLPMAKEMDKEFLYIHALSVWRVIEAEGRAFPANNISVAISGFGDVEEGVQGIQGFLVKGLQSQKALIKGQERGNEVLGKRKRDDAGIARFFPLKDDTSSGHPSLEGQDEAIPLETEMEFQPDAELEFDDTYICSRCQKPIPIQETEVHEDYHLALELSKGSPIRATPATQGRGQAIGKEEKKGPRRKPKVVEKGQRKLEFGL